MKAKEFTIKKEFVDPADDPNAGFDKEFKQDSMFNQLGKILDSQGNPRPLDTVVTDDGKKHKVNFQQARGLRRLLTAPRVKPEIKARFTKDLQTSEVLEKFLQAKDMVELFVSMYDIEQTAPSNYGD
jgi:hypothetical protein|tara:strand:+ start:1516 stop:1896 length:381 start_codon:yes stop_codon:yes gene_type:complete